MDSSSPTSREAPEDATPAFAGGVPSIMERLAVRQQEAAAEIQEITRLVDCGEWANVCPADVLRCTGEVRGYACPAGDRCPHLQARTDHRRRAYLGSLGFRGEERDPRFDRLPEEYQETVRVYAGTFEARSEAGQGLTFAGTTGAGKTCSLAYIAWALHRRGLTVQLVQAPSMFRVLDLRRSYSRDLAARGDEALSRWCEVDVLCIDEFGMEGRSIEGMAGFHQIIDARVSDRLCTFLGTNLDEEDARAAGTAEDLSRAMERLASRNPWLWTTRVSQRKRVDVREWAAGLQPQLQGGAA